MRATVALATAHDVAIGAHPGFPDLEGFGRRELDVTPRDVEDFVIYRSARWRRSPPPKACGCSMLSRTALCSTWRYETRRSPMPSRAARRHRPRSHPVWLARLRTHWGQAGAPACVQRVEGFADRAYRPNGTLVSRQDPGAVIHDHRNVVARAVRMVRDRTVEAIDGSVMPLDRYRMRAWRHAGCSKPCRRYSPGTGRVGNRGQAVAA